MSNKFRNVDRTGNSFCGPLVIAAIVGRTTGEVAERVRLECGKAVVKGMSDSHLRITLNAFGFRNLPVQLAKHYVANRGFGVPKDDAPTRNHTMSTFARPTSFGALRGHETVHCDGNWSAPFTPVKRVGPTLAAWMREPRDMDANYIVEVNSHWVLVRGRKFVDTFTGGEWVFLRSAPHRRQRVRKVWKVTT